MGHGEEPLGVVSAVVVVVRHRGNLQRPAHHEQRHQRHDDVSRFAFGGHVLVQLAVRSPGLSARGDGPDVFSQGVKRGQVGENHQHQRQHLVERQRGGGEGRALLVGGELPDAAQQRPGGAADHHQLHRSVSMDVGAVDQRRDGEDQVCAPNQRQGDENPPALPLLGQRPEGDVLPPQSGAVEGAEGQSHPAAHSAPPHPQQHEDPAPARRQGHVQAQVRHKDGDGAEERSQQVGQGQMHQNSVRGRQPPRRALDGWLQHLQAWKRLSSSPD